MARKRESNFPPPASSDPLRAWIWYWSYQQLEKNTLEPLNLTIQEAARIFKVKPSQINDIVGRNDKMRNPTAEFLNRLATAELPEGVNRPNVWYILTGQERTPGHEVCKGQLETARKAINKLQAERDELQATVNSLAKKV